MSTTPRAAHARSRCCIAACGTPTRVVSTDLRYQTGVYVVGYSPRADVRRDFEDKLVEDLDGRGMTAFASHQDIADITQSSAQEILRAASGSSHPSNHPICIAALPRGRD